MSNFFSGLGTVASIELRQRLRGRAWYVLLGIFFLLVLIVTGVAMSALSYDADPGGALYSVVVYFVLLLATLTAPALSGNAINGDREAGTLATTQITLITTAQLVLGKWLAAFVSSLAFLAAALPFILFSFVLGGIHWGTVLSSLAVLIAELAVVSAVGVGMSGLTRRPLFSIVVTYLLVALLSIGTLIAFTLGGAAIRSPVSYENHNVDYSKYPDGVEYGEDGVPIRVECTVVTSYVYETPRYDYVWWILAANPYVVIADAAPTSFDRPDGSPADMFGWIKLGVRQVQIAPQLEVTWDECNPDWTEPPTSKQVIDSTVPSWFVGLAIHLVLGGGLLAGAVAATRTPTRRLAPGSRIA